MNYKKIYNSIIKNRKLNPLHISEYGEIHHIVPTSLGGSNHIDNMVKLSAREHFICHSLLAEMYIDNSIEWYKMNHAFMMMKACSNNQYRYINNRLYELKKQDFAKVMSVSQSGSGNSQYGKPRSSETKQKISKALKREGLTKIESRDLYNRIKKENKESKNNEYYNRLFIEFNQSNCNSIRKFVRDGYYDKSHVSLTSNFKKYVDDYISERISKK
jgi:hypothetical protein